jgi:AcrR family transcriptional regulator
VPSPAGGLARFHLTNDRAIQDVVELAKGAATKDAVLDEAVQIAGRVGLSGLTIGTLASAMGMSKSGLFAHFGAKEALQLQVLVRARDEFSDQVIRPALREPRGEPRVRSLFEHWLKVGTEVGAPCLFASAGMEYDDQPGVVRDEVVRGHIDFAESVQQIFRTGISEGHFRPDASIRTGCLATPKRRHAQGPPSSGCSTPFAYQTKRGDVCHDSSIDSKKHDRSYR